MPEFKTVFLSFAVLFLVRIHCLSYNLTSIRNYTIPLNASESIVDIKQQILNDPYKSQIIYALIAIDDSYVRLFVGNATNNNILTLIQTCPIIYLGFQKSTVRSLRPTLTVLPNLIMLNFKSAGQLGINQYGGGLFVQYDIKTCAGSGYATPYYYSIEYYSKFDLIYFLDQRGVEGIYQNVSVYHQYLLISDTSTPITDTSNLTSNIMSLYLYKSDLENYAISVNTKNQIMKITVVDYALGTSPSFNSKILVTLTRPGFQSLCMYQQLYIYMHYSDGALEIYSLPTGSLISTLSTSFAQSQNCYIDTAIGALILVNENSTGTVFVPIKNSSFPVPSFYLSGYTLFMADRLNFGLICSNTFFQFNYYTCSMNNGYYAASSFECLPCPSGCTTCFNMSSCISCEQNFQLNSNNICYQEVNSVILASKKLFGNAAFVYGNSLPGSRFVLKPLLSSLISMDELYLYQFHERNYGVTFSNLFSLIQVSQNQKWSIYDKYIINPILEVLKTNYSQIATFLDVKRNYSSTYFIMIAEHGQDFFVNAWSYLTTTAITSIGIFLILQFLFYCLFRYRVSKIFRSYSFGCTLILIMLDGNLQNLVFFLCCSIKMGFSLTFTDKIMSIIAFVFMFVLTLFSVGGFALFYIRYRKLSKYFIQNSIFSTKLLIFSTFEAGIKQLILGMIHCFFRKENEYNIQLSSLLVIELISLTNYCIFLSQNVFQAKIKAIPMMMISVLKVEMLVLMMFKLNFEGNADYFGPAVIIMVQIYLALLFGSITISAAVILKTLILKSMKAQSDKPSKLAQDIKKQASNKKCGEKPSKREEISKIKKDLWNNSKPFIIIQPLPPTEPIKKHKIIINMIKLKQKSDCLKKERDRVMQFNKNNQLLVKFSQSNIQLLHRNPVLKRAPFSNKK